MRMDGAGEEFLTRAGFAGDEDRGIGGGNAADFVEDSQQWRALAGDLFKIMKRFNLFLGIKVFGLQGSTFLLPEDPLGDIDQHGGGMGALRVGVGTPIGPDRPTPRL